MLKKAQVSTEFLIFVSMSVVLLMVYMAIANNFLNIAYKQKEVISAQDLAKILRNEFNLASIVENGYLKEFQLPYQVDYKDYKIEIPFSGREISISYLNEPDIDFTEMLSTNVSVIDYHYLTPGNEILIKKFYDNVFVYSKYCYENEEMCVPQPCNGQGVVDCVFRCQTKQFVFSYECPPENPNCEVSSPGSAQCSGTGVSP
jgi:hypothetical protein